jgi:hypothetical protein
MTPDIFPSSDVRLVRVADLMTADRAEEGDPAVIVLSPQSGQLAAPAAAAAQGLRSRFVHGVQQTSAAVPSNVLSEKEAADGDDAERDSRR